MEILGYSERGIINSLIFCIGEDIALMNKFIKLFKIPELTDLGFPEDYTILLEQSFSRFGDADLILILHYKNPEHKKVIFIEGKVKTFQAKHWYLNREYLKYNKKEKYTGYSSNLFFQLRLKKLLIDEKENITTNGFAKESTFNDIRKIGNNFIVKKAFELINCSKAYYIGLIPSTEKEIEAFKLENNTGLHFLSWGKVEQFSKENNLEKVIKIFSFNKGQIYKPEEGNL